MNLCGQSSSKAVKCQDFASLKNNPSLKFGALFFKRSPAEEDGKMNGKDRRKRRGGERGENTVNGRRNEAGNEKEEKRSGKWKQENRQAK